MSARRLALAQRIAAGIVVAFWISFLGEYKQLPPAIVDFEWNFLAPDLLWIVAPLLFASRLLKTGHRKARISVHYVGHGSGLQKQKRRARPPFK